MMLRTTISRIKKVCSFANIPRFLWGDQYNGTVSSGVIRKAHKCTKATDDGGRDSTDKSNNEIPHYKFSSEIKIDDHFRKKTCEAAGLTDNTANEHKIPRITDGLPLTHRERCQKIIDEAFGKSGNAQPDRILSEQYFSHSVDLEDTRRQIRESEKAKLELLEQANKTDGPLLSDHRSEYSIFKMSRELNVKDNNNDDIMLMDSAPAREPDLSKNFENIKGTAEESPLVEERNLSQAKEDFDKCVDNPEIVERKALCDDDSKTIEVTEDEKNPDLNLKATSTYQPPDSPGYHNAKPVRETLILPDTKNVHDNQDVEEEIRPSLIGINDETKILFKDERTHDLNQKATPLHQPQGTQVLNTTTAKEEEERLTQKVETIEETPIVEAPKPKLEGFNVTPKVLGNEPTLNWNIVENKQDKSSRVNMPGAFDEVSKRCMKCPLGQIDEMLINEMEKLGMTCKSAHKAPSLDPLEDGLVQMDVSNKPPISTFEDEYISESRRFVEEDDDDIAADCEMPEDIAQSEALSPFEATRKPTEENTHHILHLHTEPVVCKSKQCNASDQYNSSPKLPCYYPVSSPPALLTAGINKQDIKKPMPDSRVPSCNHTEKHFPLYEPRSPSDTPNTHAATPCSNMTCIPNNKNSEPHSIEAFEGEVFHETAEKVQTESSTQEVKTTPTEVINTTIESVHSLHDEPDNIKQERLIKPEYSVYYSGVNAPSKSVRNDVPPPTDIQFDKNSLYSGTSNVLWGQDDNASFRKKMHEVEHDSQTKDGGEEELEVKRTTANRGLFLQVGENANKESEYSSTTDELTERCSKPEAVVQTSLPDELLEKHKLDPYYVLACNETCPISPGSAMSTSKNSDFVDTSDTIYMKQNICESLRPKPHPIDKSATISSVATHARPNVLNVENQPKVPNTSMPIAIESMPKTNEDMSLSALMRKVREKNKFLYCSKAQSELDLEAVRKCRSRAPRCLPAGPRSPPTEPVPPPTFGLPKLKRYPPICRPVKKPTNKCTSPTMKDGGITPFVPCVSDEAEVYAVLSKVTLTDEVIDRLQNLGMMLDGVLRRTKSNLMTLLARDYEPWTPIPSWKIPPKTKPKEWQPGQSCVDGCPVFPKTSASMNPQPPCDLKPCEGFPKRRSFTILDCFPVSLGEKKVYDLGNF